MLRNLDMFATRLSPVPETKLILYKLGLEMSFLGTRRPEIVLHVSGYRVLFEIDMVLQTVRDMTDRQVQTETHGYIGMFVSRNPVRVKDRIHLAALYGDRLSERFNFSSVLGITKMLVAFLNRGGFLSGPRKLELLTEPLDYNGKVIPTRIMEMEKVIRTEWLNDKDIHPYENYAAWNLEKAKFKRARKL